MGKCAWRCGCAAVGQSGEVPVLEVLNNGKYMEDILVHV